MAALPVENWTDLLRAINPTYWAAFGLVFSLCASTIGAAWGIFICGSSVMGASIKSPRVQGKNLVSILLCEASGIFGFITSFILLGKLDELATALAQTGGRPVHVYPNDAVLLGWVIFTTGITVGLSNLVSGVAVGITGSNTVLSDAQRPETFVKMFMAEIFAGVLGLFGFIIGMLQSAISSGAT